MVDPLKERLDKLRKFSDSAKRRANLYSEITNIGDKHTANSLGALQKAPAPTGITCAIGGPMIVAGRYLDKKYNGSTLHDVGHQTKNTISSISDFKNSVI